MELTMAAQDDASPWPTPDYAPASAASSDATLPGRAYFSQLGIVRRKPARGDAPPTLSKSCSDKIALKQSTSLLSSLAALLVDPKGAYIDTLVLPLSQYSSTACERAFAASGRMECRHHLSLEDAREVAKEHRSVIRAFIGYSGWGKGQLEGELAQQGWLVKRPEAELFKPEGPKRLWRDLVSTFGPGFRLTAEAPENPSLN